MNIQLAGTKAEIDEILISLKGAGYSWESNGIYHPPRFDGNHPLAEIKEFWYWLDNVVKLTYPANFDPVGDIDDDPQPRPYDAVLGGKNPPEK